MTTSSSDFAAALVADLAQSIQPCDTIFGYYDDGDHCGQPGGLARKSCPSGHEWIGYVCRQCLTSVVYCRPCGAEGREFVVVTFRTEVG